MDKRHVNSRAQDNQNRIFEGAYKVFILTGAAFIIFYLQIPVLSFITLIILLLTFI